MRQCPCDRIPDRTFVLRIGEAVQESDRHRLHLLCGKSVDRATHAGPVQSDQHLAMRIDALADGQAKPARYQRRRQIDVHVVLLEAVLMPDLHDVTKTFRGEERGPGAFALDQRIGRKRGPVNDQPNLIRRNPRLGGDGAECRQDTFLRHRRCGQSLGGEAALSELERYIGESAADIDTKTDCRGG